MSKVDHKGRTKSATQPFVQVLKPTLQEPAWKALPYGARCLYITLKSFFTGSNNGRLYLSVRKAANELGASSTSTERWFQDLIKHGFIVPTAGGFLGAEGKGTATYWRLTELGFNGEQPTRDYKDWPDLKNRPPSQKKGRTVPKIGTPCPQNRDTCPQNRDGFDPITPADRPQNRDVSNLPCTEGKRTRSTANGTDPEQALVERVARLSGLSNLNMTPAAVGTALNPTTRKRLLAGLNADRLTDADLVREAVAAAKGKRCERRATRTVGPMP